MTITDDVLTRLARAAADRIACAPEDRQHLAANLVAVFRGELHAAFGGEVIRLYAGAKQLRAEQRLRILQALDAGEPAPTVARREHVTERWVRQLRKRGTIRP